MFYLDITGNTISKFSLRAPGIKINVKRLVRNHKADIGTVHICIHKADTGVCFQLSLLCHTQRMTYCLCPQLVFQIVVYCKGAQKLTFSGMCMLHSVGFCFMSRMCIRAF